MLDLVFEGLAGGGGIGIAAGGEVVFDDVLFGAEKALGFGRFEIARCWHLLVRRDTYLAAFVGQTADDQFAGGRAGISAGGFDGAVHHVSVKGKVLAACGCGDLFRHGMTARQDQCCQGS